MITILSSKSSNLFKLFLDREVKGFLKTYIQNISPMCAENININLLKPLNVKDDCLDIICRCIVLGKFKFVQDRYVLEINETEKYDSIYTYKDLYQIIDKGNLSCKGLNFEILLNDYLKNNVVRLYSIYKERGDK